MIAFTRQLYTGINNYEVSFDAAPSELLMENVVSQAMSELFVVV